MKWNSLKVVDIVAETDDAVSVYLDNTPKLIFSPGQYLTCRVTIAGEEVRRSYSLSNLPYQDTLRIGIKKVPGGKFSTYANEILKIGDSIDVMDPMGNFTLSHTKENGHLVLIAAGSGITPILSIAKYWLSQKEDTLVTMIYGNKKATAIMYHEELEELKNSHLDRFQLFHTFSQESIGPAIGRGRISTEKLDKILTLLSPTDFYNTEFFMCGPQYMTMELIDYFKQKEVPKTNVHFELFTTNEAKKNKEKIAVSDSIDMPQRKSKVTIKIDGDEIRYDHNEQDGVILDAAGKKSGVDLPFACLGGVCSTCKAKLIKGEVKMDVNFALEEDELVHGFILTCQAHPLTEEVVIDYDDLSYM